jgi:hypothetical protein
MRQRTLCFVTLGLVTLAAMPGGAQPARVGRLPILTLPTQDARHCAALPVTRDLDREGIVHLVTLNDSATHHFVSLAIDRSGEPKLLDAMMTTTEARRHESEAVTVGFDVYGKVMTGRRMAMTGGTPASTSEDRRVALFPGDTTQIVSLVKAVRRLCHV